MQLIITIINLGRCFLLASVLYREFRKSMKKTQLTFKEDRIIISEKSNISIIHCKDLVAIFCEHPYLKLLTVQKNNILIFYPLMEIVRHLPPLFVLCNRSSLINLSYVHTLRIEKMKWVLYLSTGDCIFVSRRKKADVKKQLNDFLTV